jgi:hypothetical protein
LEANSIKYMSYFHKDKIRICLRGFGWTQFASRDSISYETRWEYLTSRHKYRKLTTLYKMLISLCRQILVIVYLLPYTISMITIYETMKIMQHHGLVDIGHHFESVLVAKQRLGWPLWNICVVNDHGYISMVAYTKMKE